MNLAQRIKDALLDPQRRKQVWWRTVEAWSGTALLLLLFLAAAIEYGFPLHLVVAGIAAALLGAAVEFLLYELWLEPTGRAGHYWERLPPDGKTFTRW